MPRFTPCLPLGWLFDSCQEDAYLDDLLLVTKGKTDESPARMVIRTSATRLPWMAAHGVRFQPSLSGSNAFIAGGGRALISACCNTAEDPGVRRGDAAQLWHAHGDGAPFPACKAPAQMAAGLAPRRGVCQTGGPYPQPASPEGAAPCPVFRFPKPTRSPFPDRPPHPAMSSSSGAA